MTRETLIQQLSADVAGACACHKMREATRKITRKYNDALKPAGIKATQFSILAAVGLYEGITLTQMANRLGLDRTTLSRNLGPIERRGLIEIRDDGHGRARSAILTSKGVAVMETALPLWREAQATLKGRLGEENWNLIHAELAEIKQLA